MTILAIDPGSERSAWVTLESGFPVEHGKVANEALLQRLRMADPDRVPLAIEMIASYGMAVGREVFETCVWIGRFQEAWESRGGTTQLIYRREVKLHHCHSAKASDSNIRAALIDRFGPGKDRAVGTKASKGPLFGIKADAWSALAIALTVYDEPTLRVIRDEPSVAAGVTA